MTIYGVILAGGQGSRLGHVRKAELRLGGMRLRDRVAARLRKHVGAILPDVPDLPGVSGPLGGIVSAVRHLAKTASADDILISVAVDTPFLPTDYVPRLGAALDHAPAAYVAWADNFYPTNAAFRFGAIADLPERAAEMGSPRRLLQGLGAIPVTWDESDDPFANLNTLADLIALSRRTQ